MNIHVLQNYNATAEAKELLISSRNLLNPKDGSLNVSLIQDFITFSYLISSNNIFLTKQQFSQMFLQSTNCEYTLNLPMPCILYPKQLWTGKQLI